jgi:glucokinase
MDTFEKSVQSTGVMAPGTGRGKGFIAWTGERHLPVASEGGHANFFHLSMTNRCNF